MSQNDPRANRQSDKNGDIPVSILDQLDPIVSPNRRQNADLEASEFSDLVVDSTTAFVHQPTPSAGVALYEAARRALAEAQRVDELKDVRDRAVALAEYARQAADTQLIGYATEIRLRAERRAGEVLAEMAQRGERDNGRGNRNPGLKSQAATPKLSNLGINKSQSSRWQKLARLSEPEFEGKVEQSKTKAVSAIDRMTNPARKSRDTEAAQSTTARAIRRAVRILSTAEPDSKVAAALTGTEVALEAEDLDRAIGFLQELRRALSGSTEVLR